MINKEKIKIPENLQHYAGELIKKAETLLSEIKAFERPSRDSVFSFLKCLHLIGRRPIEKIKADMKQHAEEFSDVEYITHSEDDFVFYINTELHQQAQSNWASQRYPEPAKFGDKWDRQ